MRLSAPTKPVFWLSILLGVVGFVFSLGIAGIPAIVGPIIQLCALAILALACLLKGM